MHGKLLRRRTAAAKHNPIPQIASEDDSGTAVTVTFVMTVLNRRLDILIGTANHLAAENCFAQAFTPWAEIGENNPHEIPRNCEIGHVLFETGPRRVAHPPAYARVQAPSGCSRRLNSFKYGAVRLFVLSANSAGVP